VGVSVLAPQLAMAVTAGGSLTTLSEIASSIHRIPEVGVKSAPVAPAAVSVHAPDVLDELIREAILLREESLTRTSRSRPSSRGIPRERTKEAPVVSDMRRLERIRKRHEWYQQQAALPGRIPTSEEEDARIRAQAAACLETTDTKRDVERAIQTYDMHRASVRQSLHNDWTLRVFEPTTKRLVAAVERRGGAERHWARNKEYDAFLAHTAAASRLYLDDVGEREGDYDPLLLNRTSIRVRGVRDADDPLKRGISVLNPDNAGRPSRAGRAIQWKLPVPQQKQSVKGKCRWRSCVDMDHFLVLRGNEHVTSELPRLGRRTAKIPRKVPAWHDTTSSVFDEADADVPVDLAILEEHVVKRCT
jgi:hypothetical protein